MGIKGYCVMKNVLLLFLSEIHLDKEKHLSVTSYHADGLPDISCVQTNEAAVRFLMQKLALWGERLDYIFAFSTKKTQKDIEYLPADGGQFVKVKQRDIFSAAISRTYPELADRIIYVDYDEFARSGDIIKYVMQMVDKIHDVVNDNPTEWRLHTDLTGGMRHVTVLMLSVLHMLKYSGISIGMALYAAYFKEDTSKNRIDDVSNIHRMFEMVSSTDSIFNFASLREIDRYFVNVPQESIGPELRALLKSLTAFSDAVKICRTGKFEAVLHELADNIRLFKECRGKSAQERLFAQVLEALERDYGDIIRQDVSRISIVRWCLGKGFLQQAMTLFNEWMPAEMIGRKLYYPNPLYKNKIYEKCKAQNMGYKLSENVFVHDFYGTLESLGIAGRQAGRGNVSAISTKFFAPFRALMQDGGVGDKPENLSKEILDELLMDIKCLAIHQMNLQQGKESWDCFEAKHGKLMACVQHKKERDVFHSYMSLQKYFLHPSMTDRAMYKSLVNAKTDFLYDLFEIPPAQREECSNLEDKSSEAGIALKWEMRKQNIENMLDSGIAVCGSDSGRVLDVLEILHWIRNQRNQINHAYNGDEVADTGEIEMKIVYALDCIEEMTGA